MNCIKSILSAKQVNIKLYDGDIDMLEITYDGSITNVDINELSIQEAVIFRLLSAEPIIQPTKEQCVQLKSQEIVSKE